MPGTPAVVVGICTFRRPQQLDLLLQEVEAARCGPLAALEVSVVVVDDDPQGSGRPVVEAAAARSTGPVRYHHLGSRNLSHARNAVIEQALPHGDWVAFVDDDCLPEPDWLLHLLAVQERTAADLVTGHVVYRVRPGAPRWLVDEPFCDFTAYEDGEEPAYGNTANVLMSTGFLRRSGTRFRESLGRTGGEDMTFYDDARAAGARLRYAASARVHEPLTPARERLGYHLHRQFWLGNNMVVINRHTHAERMSRMLLRGGKRVLVSGTAPVRRWRRGEPLQLRWSLAHALQGLGLVLGVLGVTVSHRP